MVVVERWRSAELRDAAAADQDPDYATVPLRALDAVRIGPESVRAFEAGDEGMDYLAVGPRTPNDGEILPGWWTD